MRKRRFAPSAKSIGHLSHKRDRCGIGFADGAKGFTLIELVMVLLVVAILSVAIMTDLVSSVSSVRLEAAKWKLKSDIIYAQNLAVTQSINHGVIFDPDAETYSLYSQTTSNIIDDPQTTAPFTINYTTDPSFKGIGINSTSFGFPTTNRLEFDDYGRPYSDAGITLLVDNGTIILGSGGSTVPITVTKNTGKVN